MKRIFAVWMLLVALLAVPALGIAAPDVDPVAAAVPALTDEQPGPVPFRAAGAEPIHTGTGGIRLQSVQDGAPTLAPGTKGLFVVQFKGAITDASWAALRGAGAEVGSYLSQSAFLVRITQQGADELAANGIVLTVFRYRPEWKVDPGLNGASGTADLRVITFAAQADATAGAVSALDAGSGSAGLQSKTVSMDRAAAPSLAADENVVYIEAVPTIELTNDVATGIMRASQTGGPWANGVNGAGQVVGVADSGLDTGVLSTLHPDLRNHIQGSPVAYGRYNNWSDPHGHGTHVAGSIVGDGRSGGVYPPPKGTAPGAKIFFESLLTYDGGLYLPAEGVSKLFATAKNNGATIHTNSWGQSKAYAYNSDSRDVDAYTWANKEFTVLFAAGNDGVYGNGTVTAPGTAKNAITVGASESYRPGLSTTANDPDEIAYFSGHGTADGRVKPDVVAPGTWILSTHSSLAPGNVYDPSSRYTYMSGTSMATPLTAGATAVVRDFYQHKKSVTSPSAALLKATLINGAQDMGYGWGNPAQGWGRVDLTNSLYPENGRVNLFDDNKTGLKTGELAVNSYTASAGEILKFSLVWTDYPGSTVVTKTLVNDLDLIVVGPDGSFYRGNCFANNTAAPDCFATADRANNVENVYIAAPTAGTYQVMVKGTNVPMGPQPFALVASGMGLSKVTTDTAAPTLSTPGLTAGQALHGATTIVGDAQDNAGLAAVEFLVDGTPRSLWYGYRNGTTHVRAEFSFDTTWVLDGAHTLKVIAWDAAGHQTSTSVNVTVDNQAPVITGMTPGDGGFVRGTAPVTVTATDNAAVRRAEFYLDDATQPSGTVSAAPFTWAWNTTGVTAGRHSVTAMVYDAAGNMAAETSTVTVDNDAPTVGITAPASGASFQARPVEVAVDAADANGVAKVEYFLGTTAANGVKKATLQTAPYTWTWDTSTATSGTYVLVARATDMAGNTAQSTVTVTVDSVKPAVSITRPTANAALHGNIDVTANATDNKAVAKVEFYLDGALQATDTATPFVWTWGTATASDGAHTLSAKAYDAAGNVTASSSVAVQVDNTPPVASISAPADGASVKGSVMVTAAAGDNSGRSSVVFLVDGVAKSSVLQTAPFAWSFGSTAVPNGPHTLSVLVTDPAGNVTTAAPITVTVDNAPPTATFSGLTAGRVVKGTVDLSATAADNRGVARVEFCVDGVAKYTDDSAPYTWSWDTTAATNASHSVTVKAYDAAGNVAAAPAVSVTVDNQAPVISGITAGSAGFVRGQVPVTATVSDNKAMARVEFYLDDADQPVATDTTSPYAWTWNTAQATAGSHQVTVKAYDGAGNVAARTLSATVDNDAPTVSITAPASGATLPAGTFDVTVSATDANDVVRVEYYLGTSATNGVKKYTAQTAPFTWSWATSATASGNYVIVAKAYDQAGNMAQTSLPVTLDSAKPTITITNPAANATLRGSVNVTASAADARGVTAVSFYLDGVLQSTDTASPYVWTWDTTAADGPHVLTAEASDAAGNVTAARSVAVVVDNTVPEVSFSTLQDGAVVRGTAVLAATATDTGSGAAAVTFYLNGVSRTTDTTAPFSWTLPSLVNGTYTVKLQARDRAGNTAESAAVSLVVDNTAPTLSVSGIAGSTTVKGEVSVSVTVTDPNFDRVDLLIDGQVKDTAAGTNATLVWNTTAFANGSHQVIVKAYDKAGNAATKSMSVTVRN